MINLYSFNLRVVFFNFILKVFINLYNFCILLYKGLFYFTLLLLVINI